MSILDINKTTINYWRSDEEHRQLEREFLNRLTKNASMMRSFHYGQIPFDRQIVLQVTLQEHEAECRISKRFH